MLIGEHALLKLNSAHVAVFGLGGVGSWCAEALARAGIGEMTLVDSDEYSISNINRQAGAFESTVGEDKVTVTAKRLLDINPEIKVHPLKALYSSQTRDDLIKQYDYVADCIDLVSCKIDLIKTCTERQIPIISSMGTGNKSDASLLEITDISKTKNCALSRVMRKELRAVGINHLCVVYSPEDPIEAEQIEAPPPGRRSIPGSFVWVPAGAGLLIAQKIVTDIIKR